MDQPTVAGSSVRALCYWMLDRGAKVDEFLKQEQLNLDALGDQNVRVSLASFNRLWELASQRLEDPAVGLHVGEFLDSSRMGVFGHIVYNNHTLEQALRQYVRLSHLVNEGVVTAFRIEGEEAIVEYHCEAEHYNKSNMERMLALSITRARRYVSEKIFLVRVGFSHRKPRYGDEYERIFQCPVEFSKSYCFVSFHTDFLGFELPHRNPYLHQALTRQVEALLQKLDLRRGVSHRVKTILLKRLSRGDFDAEKVAEKLNMSRHTLYRKLKQEGHSFQDLVEEVRRGKAMEYLEKNKYSLSEIAFLLGFSELSAFSRAFKRWTGKSPAQYRNEVRDA